MVDVMNSLTHVNDVPDEELFDGIIDNHYLKFKEFYNMVGECSSDKIDKMNCTDTDDKMSLRISVKNKKDVEEVVDTIKNSNFNREEFESEVYIDSDDICINISLKNHDREDELHYANRII